MKVHYTHHARHRMDEMHLTPGDIQRTLKEPEVITPANRTKDRYGRPTGDRTDASQYRRDGIAVVAKPADDGGLLVITVLERRTDQYERRGVTPDRHDV